MHGFGNNGKEGHAHERSSAKADQRAQSPVRRGNGGTERPAAYRQRKGDYEIANG